MKGRFESAPDGTTLTFEDGTPAVIEKTVGRGRIVHFTWMPGLSYWKSSAQTSDRLPVGFSDSIRHLILHPTELAKVEVPVTVSRRLVETPLLLSDGGAAVTLLNWTGQPIEDLQMTVRVPFVVKSIESVRGGKVSFQKTADGVTLSLPLASADILLLRP